METATTAGATVLPVAGVAGFIVGQAIVVGSGANAEEAVVAATNRFGMTITAGAPLTLAHEGGAQVAGTRHHAYDWIEARPRQHGACRRQRFDARSP